MPALAENVCGKAIGACSPVISGGPFTVGTPFMAGQFVGVETATGLVGSPVWSILSMVRIA